MKRRGTLTKPPFQPPALRWFIGVELARYREEAGLSMAKAAGMSGITKPKISHLELGRQQQSSDDITRLLTIYGADRRDVMRLIELANRSDEASWWAPWTDVVPPWLTVFVGLERLADRAHVYQPTLIPGLLQTTDYATLIAERSLLVRADHIQRVVEFRAARAARLTASEGPLWLHAVIGAAALENVVGSAEVYEGQLLHLIKLAELPTITIQVLPFGAGPLGVHGTGGFVLLHLDDVSQIGYIELLDDAVYLHQRRRLQTYGVGFSDLQRVALDPERSLALIRSKIA